MNSISKETIIGRFERCSDFLSAIYRKAIGQVNSSFISRMMDAYRKRVDGARILFLRPIPAAMIGDGGGTATASPPMWTTLLGGV